MYYNANIVFSFCITKKAKGWQTYCRKIKGTPPLSKKLSLNKSIIIFPVHLHIPMNIVPLLFLQTNDCDMLNFYMLLFTKWYIYKKSSKDKIGATAF